MEDLVRPFQAPSPAPGFRAPSTSGSNPDTAATEIGNRPNGQTDQGPYARVDQPEDYKWWPRLKMLVSGALEVTSDWINVSNSVVIDPNICSVWRLSCQSASLAITFVDLEVPTWIEQMLIWAGVKRVATIEIIINWGVAASGARTLTLSGVRFPDGTAPDWTATAGRDVVIIQKTSDGELYGFAAGLDMRVP